MPEHEKTTQEQKINFSLPHPLLIKGPRRDGQPQRMRLDFRTGLL
jgi:hypothetical protein